jgi:hypothetical protein
MLNDVRQALVRGCRAPEGVVTFLRMQGLTQHVSVIGNDLSAAANPFEFSGDTAPDILHETANRMPAPANETRP